MGYICGILYSLAAILLAIGGFLRLRKEQPSYAPKRAPKYFGAAIVLSMVGIISFTVASANSAHAHTTVKQSAQAVVMPTPAPAPPRYDASAILKEARKAYALKRYEHAVEVLYTLHPADMKKGPAVRLLHRAEYEHHLANIAARQAYATKYEELLLTQGIDATVRAEGYDRKTLFIETPVMTHALSYQMMNPQQTASADLAEGDVSDAESIASTNFSGDCSAQGFTRVLFSDGDGTEWLYKLN